MAQEEHETEWGQRQREERETKSLSLPDRVLKLEMRFDFLVEKMNGVQWWMRWLVAGVGSSILLVLMQFVFKSGSMPLH